jgi:hypothetical protein
MYVHEFNVTPEGLEEIETFIKENIAEYKRCREIADDDIPPCSPEQRWEKPTKYAVMKGANKRACRVMDTPEEAEKMVADMGAGYSVEVRPGESVRCMDYCSVAEYCSFYKTLGVENGEDN